MLFDCRPVVRPDVDVDSDHAPPAKQLAEGGVIDERTSVRDAALDDHVRLDTINHLLNTDDVLRQLNDRAAEPAEGIDVFLVPADLEPELGKQLETFRRIELERRFAPFTLGQDDSGLRVDCAL